MAELTAEARARLEGLSSRLDQGDTAQYHTWGEDVAQALATIDALTAEVERWKAKLEMIQDAEEGGGKWPDGCIAEIDALEEKWSIDLCSTGFAGRAFRYQERAIKERDEAVSAIAAQEARARWLEEALERIVRMAPTPGAEPAISVAVEALMEPSDVR